MFRGALDLLSDAAHGLLEAVAPPSAPSRGRAILMGARVGASASPTREHAGATSAECRSDSDDDSDARDDQRAGGAAPRSGRGGGGSAGAGPAAAKRRRLSSGDEERHLHGVAPPAERLLPAAAPSSSAPPLASSAAPLLARGGQVRSSDDVGGRSALVDSRVAAVADCELALLNKLQQTSLLAAEAVPVHQYSCRCRTQPRGGHKANLDKVVACTTCAATITRSNNAAYSFTLPEETPSVLCMAVFALSVVTSFNVTFGSLISPDHSEAKAVIDKILRVCTAWSSEHMALLSSQTRGQALAAQASASASQQPAPELLRDLISRSSSCAAQLLAGSPSFISTVMVRVVLWAAGINMLPGKGTSAAFTT
jgi:hypothetical protein